MIYDISPPLSPATAVWPGDQPLKREVLLRIEDGASVDLSTLITTVHVGAHADAPSHYKVGQPTIDQVDLTPYLGPCRVVATKGHDLVRVDDCRDAVARGAKRILFKTGTQPDSTRFDEDFAAFDPDAIHFMGEAGVLLVGIDTASVDPFSSKDLPSHNALLRYGMRNLEGLDLSAVPEGDYELIALPLKLVGFDASPVRAILRTLDLP